jgi:diguanylate cyclase (GGDEF)-like protein
MHTSASLEEPLTPPPECDREQFAARNESFHADVADLPPDGGRQHGSTFSTMKGTALLPLLGVTIIAIADRFADRALGANLWVSLLMVIPIFWATREAGVKSGMLVAGASCLLWRSSDLLALSPTHLRSFPFAMAGIHMALFAATVALAVEQRRLREERSVATTDFLTGIANRRGFYEMLTREIERSRRYRTPMTLLYLDCDEFKAVNDTMGHPAGNSLLAKIATVLKENTRAVDMVGRLGGDEFAIMLAETPAEHSAEAVARLQREMRSALRDEIPAVTFSIGAITFDSPPTNPNEAIRIADALMYEAKRAGKDRVVHAIAG